MDISQAILELFDYAKSLFEINTKQSKHIAELEQRVFNLEFRISSIESKANFAYNRTVPIGQIGAGGSAEKIY